MPAEIATAPYNAFSRLEDGISKPMYSGILADWILFLTAARYLASTFNLIRSTIAYTLNSTARTVIPIETPVGRIPVANPGQLNPMLISGTLFTPTHTNTTPVGIHNSHRSCP